MSFFNVVATPGFGIKKDVLKQAETSYGQGQLSINVNSLNGNLFVKDFAQTFIEQGFPFTVGYQYNSQSTTNPWRLNQGKTIGRVQGKEHNAPNSFVLVEESDGSKTKYTYNSKYKCYIDASDPDGSSRLKYTKEGKWVGWNPSSNTKETYNKHNQISTLSDASGNFLQFDYDKQQRLTAISGASDPSVLIEYDAQTTKVFSIDGDNKALVAQYHFEDNRLLKTLVPVNFDENYEINYQYTQDTNLLERIRQSDTTEVTFDYEKNSGRYQLNQLADGTGTKYTLKHEENSIQLVDPFNVEQTFLRNTSGLLESHEQEQEKKEYVYDELNRVKKVTYQDNTFKEYNYDDLGFCSEIVGRTGEKTLFRHDPKTGLLLCQSEVLTSEESERYLNTFFVYNDKQQPAYTIAPNGTVHAYTYDAHGNRISQKIYLTAFYDVSSVNKDSALSEKMLADWCAKQNPTDIALTEWTYNKLGQKSSQIIYANIGSDGKGIKDKFAAYEEFAWTIHGDLTTHKTKLNAQNTAIQSAEYDGLSRPVSETDPLEQTTKHTYKDNEHQTTFLPTGLTTTNSYNKAANILQTLNKSGELSNSTAITYDIGGYPCIFEFENGTKEYLAYDEYNQVKFRIDKAKRPIEYQHDPIHHLSHKIHYSEPLTTIDEKELLSGIWPEPTGTRCIETSIFDASGRLLCTIDGDNFVTRHRYDSVGNRIETIHYATRLDLSDEQRLKLESIPEILENEDDRVHRYFYDDAKQLVGEQLPIGQVIAYTRNALGDVLTKTTTLAPLETITQWNPKLVAQVAHKKETNILDARGQCLEHINAEEETTSQIWDAGGRLAEKTVGDETQNFDWNAKNQSVTERSSSGLEVNKTYAPCGKLKSCTKKDTLAQTPSRDNFTRYNGFNQPTHELTPRAALKLSDPAIAADKTLVEWIWQNESIRHEYDHTGLKRSTTDELGNSTYFYYNSARELCFTINPTGSIVEYTYENVFKKQQSKRQYATCLNDSELAQLTGGIISSDLTAKLHAKQSDDDALETTYYNNRGLVAHTVDPEGYNTYYEYDAFDNVVFIRQQIDKDNYLECKMEYDKASRPILKIKDVNGLHAVESWAYVDENKSTLYTDANNNVSRTYVDNLNRKLKTINQLGHKVSFKWDALSRLVELTDAKNKVTTRSYENHGRKIITKTPLSETVTEKNAFGEVELEQNADGKTKKTIRDVDGQVKTRIDEEGNQYTNEHNIAGWLTATIDPQNNKTSYEHTNSGCIERQIEEGVERQRITRFRRNAQGLEIERIDAKGVKTQTLYDKRGLKKEKIIDPDKLGLSTRYERDGLEHIVKTVIKDNIHPEQFVTDIVRDKLGRVVMEIKDPDDLKLATEIIYHPVANYVQRIDANRHSSYTCFDVANRERFFIDACGGVIEFVYDKNDNIIQERHYAIPLKLESIKDFSLENIEQLVTVTRSNKDKLSYFAYDADNKRVASLDPRGKLTTYRHNAQGKKTYEYSYATPATFDDFEAQCTVPTKDDRQCAWFYDKRGKERFSINGEGIVTEKCWNDNGWLIEERTFANPYFDYDHCPDRNKLAHEDDRFTRYIHDEFGRVVFEVNSEGYVTEYEYDEGDHPTITWFYPDKIPLPQEFSTSSIQTLLPNKSSIPYTQTIRDAATRKKTTIDQLGCKEEFTLNALSDLTQYIDKGEDSWTFAMDKAGRKHEEATPPVAIESVSRDGVLSRTNTKQRIVKKTQFAGNIERITEAYGTDEARTLELHKNPLNQVIKTVQEGVLVYDSSKKPEPGKHPETKTTLSTHTVYNAFKKPIVKIDEAGHPKFLVYKGDDLCYEIDEEGYVTGSKHNVFGNPVTVTRYAEPLKLNLEDYIKNGITIEAIEQSPVLSGEYRCVHLQRDRANRPTSATFDSVFVYLAQESGESKHGMYSRKEINVYNSFDEIKAIKRLVDPFNDLWDITRNWFNKAGHRLAQLDGLNHLTTFTPNRNGDSLETIEYANPVPLAQEEDSLETLLQKKLKKDRDKDRKYTNEFDVRGDLETTTQHNVYLVDPEWDASGLQQPVPSSPQTLVTSRKRNAKGLVISETAPNKAVRNTQYDPRNLPVLKTEPVRTLETSKATPVTTLGYNAFAQPTRLTHHKNPYEHDAYLQKHPEDQVHLTGYETRGLQVVTVDPEQAKRFQSFTETRKVASHWLWVTGWEAADKPIKRLHQTIFERDRRGIETRSQEAIESGSTVITDTLSNSFGEKIAQGYGSGTYPVYWLRDKSGAVWNTNEQNGVPTIILRDLSGNETVTLRSRTFSLQQIQTPEALAAIMDLDYQSLQREELLRDVLGNVTAQRTPAFSSLTADEPEPYLLNIRYGKQNPELDTLSLSWPIPDIAGLEPVITLWPKGRPDEQVQPVIIKNATDYGVDVSGFFTDEYEYQIDFYYQDPDTKKSDEVARYRSEGSVCIITDKVKETDNLLWQQLDNQHLVLYGKLGDITGIELLQEGQAVGRVAITSTDNPHRWMVDLSDKVSGHYAFRYVRGFSLLEEQALAEGMPSATGTRIDKIATQFDQAYHFYLLQLKADVTSSWNNLPPQITNLHQELKVINAESVNPLTLFTVYGTQAITKDLPTVNTGSVTATFSNQLTDALTQLSKFSATISHNRLYSVDANGKQWTVAEIRNPLDGVKDSSSTYLYLQSKSDLSQAAALRARFADGSFGKTCALEPWINNTWRCSGSFANEDATYEVVSLQSSIADTQICGEITLHTAHVDTKKVLVREIALTKPSVSKILTFLANEETHNGRDALNFTWNLPGFLSTHQVKVHFELTFHAQKLIEAYGERYDFEYILGHGHHTAYNGHLIPGDALRLGADPNFADFELSHLNLYVEYEGDWIPLLSSNTFTMDHTLVTKDFTSSMQVTMGGKTSTATSNQYQEGDVASFSDTYTLLFYPLPAELDPDTLSIEYWDSSLLIPEWKSLPDAQFTGHAVASSANSIAPGEYQYRLKAKNKQAQDLDFAGMTEHSEDGWAYGHFTVTHGNSLTQEHKTQVSKEVIRPVNKQKVDRWGNVLSTTNALQHTTEVNFNGRNKPLKKTQPAIEVTDEQGRKSIVAPTERSAYDKADNVVAVKDANGHVVQHQRALDGKVQQTTRADTYYKKFLRDIFGRVHTAIEPLDRKTHYQHDRCNRKTKRTDACGWETDFAYNELSLRLGMAKGKNKNKVRAKEWLDYRHPSNHVTDHYLPDRNYLMTREYQQHGVTTKEQLPDGRVNTWGTDDFGNTVSHTDLGGADYTYRLNQFYPIEVLAVCSTVDHHGQRMTKEGQTASVRGQNLVFLYDEASQKTAIHDNALSTKTYFRIDALNRRARETFITSDGHIHQAVSMKWNAVGWIEEVQDILLKARFTHDAKGNRRSILASVFWEGSWRVDTYQSWNTYDAADKMLIVNGVLIDGTIQIASGHGTKLIYDITTQRREHEIIISPEGQQIDTTIAYLANNLLEHTSSTNNIYRRWAYDGDTPLRSEFITRAGTNTTTRASQYNLNSWLTHDDFVNGKQKLATGYTLNAIGLPDSQSTTLTLDGKKEYEEELSFAYVAFDTDKIATVAGHIQRTDGGTTKSEANSYYDPNSSIELITSSKEATRRFITNSAGLILQKTQGADKKEYYLFTTSGQFLGCFGNSPPEGLNVPLPHIELNLNFQPVSEHFPAPTPDTYVVQLNDTFASIAERVLKDARFAAEIADVNAYRSDDIPAPGSVLQIPNLVNTNVHNWEGMYPSYNPSAIMGSIYPHMKMPHRYKTNAKRANFWHTVLEEAIGMAIIAFAPQIAGLFTGAFSQFASQLLGFALAGAASSITQQELAIGLGDQTEAFSLNAVGQNALLTMATMGASKALKLDALRAARHALTVTETIKNIELTIATQALSFATGQQRHFDWRILAASVASTMANLGAAQIESKIPIYNDALATASASVASIGMYQLLGANISTEAIAATALGTVIGNQVAAQAKAHFDQFQKKREQQKSQIPEIYAQLAESERDFIQSVLEHPHDFGKSAARENAHATVTPNTHAPNPANNKPTEKLPPQEHLMVTRAEKEERMSRAARWNEEQSAARNQPRPSQGGFWSSAIDRAANSNLVTTINTVGDNVAHAVDEIFNPITQFKHAMEDANESIQAMKSGDIKRATIATVKTSLDVFALVPIANLTGKGVGYLTKVGIEHVFLGGGAATVGKGFKASSNYGATGRLQLEKLRTKYRQEANWINPKEINNEHLKNVVNDLYRVEAKVGSGSTADALRVEIAKPGLRVGEKFHITKAKNYERALHDLLKGNTLTAHERMIAENVRLDLLDAMGEKLWYSQTITPKF